MTELACATNVLVADDEPRVTRLVLAVLAQRGLAGRVARDGAEALRQIDTKTWGMIFTDLRMPDADGFAVLRHARANLPEVPVVMITGYGSVELAVEAMQAGCNDFVMKPLTPERVEGLLDLYLPNHRVPRVWEASEEPLEADPIVGTSRALRRTFEMVRRAAPTAAPMLIEGESGTGKELIARLAHKLSARAGGPFIRVNCASLSETLLESELFGHERGAFTGAHMRRKGRFERAHGGTLLLDEITETTPRFQAELLRVLEQQDFERLGGTEAIQVNVRVISTTNRDLGREVGEGRFRADLYYRLGGIRVTLPPLRERPEDIPALVWHFVNLYSREARRHVRELDEGMIERFRSYAWPGNVRELRNVVRTALILGEGETLGLVNGQMEGRETAAAGERGVRVGADLASAERELILATLERVEGNRRRAAALLGITDRTLRTKLKQYEEKAEGRDKGRRQKAESEGEGRRQERGA